MDSLNDLITNFSVNKLKQFFMQKINSFKPNKEDYGYLFENAVTENYKDMVKIGEAELLSSDDLLITAAETLSPLTDRTGKKKQYEIAKKILKEENRDAAFFIFYDAAGNFRFSFIKANFIDAKRNFTSFKRYTYFVSRKLTNKTFITQISKCNFNDLDSIKEAFSVEPITKEFYEKLQHWYFWAAENVEFPGDAEEEPSGREISIIRLITRLIFIWFMKVRNLIPDNLFDESKIRETLKDCSDEQSTYYKAILQNLFFATLNTEQKKRRFRSEKRGIKGYNPDYGNHHVYRYHNLFKNDSSLSGLFEKIPFLNGGLFECLDYKTKAKEERKYIDGFTAAKSQQPKVPNFLFFSEIKKVDLSGFLNGKGKTYEVQGLINLLKNYNFTIDENEPDDIEIALEPELLGTIFENLLASYNPATATTARKATGSFYTPREIVDYMTTESLKQYFCSNISNESFQLSGGIALKQDALSTSGTSDAIVIKHGKLPHWTQDNAWYFVTFRLADSIPIQKLEQLQSEREMWLRNHKKKEGNEYTKEEQLKEYDYLFSERIENWLNAEHGKCVLKDESNAKIVSDALKYFEGKRYELDEWVIMPNHVHVLLKPLGNYKLSDIVHSWKSFTANKINKNLNTNGQLWTHESYDRIVRNEKAFRAIENYIRYNPAKASTVTKASSFQEQETSKQDALDTLFDTNSENPFDEKTTKKIINLINELRVVDPAVGSGAFPMAVLKKLVFILGKLDPANNFWKQSQINGIKKSVSDPTLQKRLITEIEQRFKEKNADYGRKLYLIEKCIYGVDIQQIAIEIAKLRFFISLLVDEKIDFNKPNYDIQPLPNLDFKLMQGNSLLSTFAGINFNPKVKQAGELPIDKNHYELIKRFEELKNQYQNEFNRENKERLHGEIKKTILKIFEERINPWLLELKAIEDTALSFPKEEQRRNYTVSEKQKLVKKRGFDIEQLEKDFITYTEGRKLRNFFLWDVYFAEVFQNTPSFEHPSVRMEYKGGFDIVIGNPPYIQLQKAINGKQKFADLYKNEKFETFERTGDIYALFYEKGIDILTEKGLLCYITSNKWMRTNYGKSLRRFFSKNNPLKLVDLGPGVFNAATVNTNILIVAKNTDTVVGTGHAMSLQIQMRATQLTEKNKRNIANLSDNDFIVLKNLSENSWIILTPEEQKIKQKIERIGTPLKDWDISIYRGILTGYNEAFIIDGKTKDELIAKDPKSADIIKPILRGRDIKRYKAEFADLWLINSHNRYKRFPSNRGVDSRSEDGVLVPPTNISNYPAIKQHLDKYWEKLEKRQDKGVTPYNLRNCAYLEEFEKEKIVYPEIVRSAQFYYDNNKFYAEATSFILTGEHVKYLKILLNSFPVTYFFKNFYAGGGLGEDGYRYKKVFLINLPIPKIPKEAQKPFEALVDKIIAKKEAGKDTAAEEQEIDLMVYKLYELTYEEVKIVDRRFWMTREEYLNYYSGK